VRPAPLRQIRIRRWVGDGSVRIVGPGPCLALVALTAGCASAPRPVGQPETVQEHVYARPLDDVLTETTTVLTEQGWRVQRSGDQLGTGWRPAGTGSASGLRVTAERIDVDHCRIQIERVNAVSLGPAIEERGSRQSSLGADITAGSDRLDAPSTLGSPPPGLGALPAGRDEDLELLVLQRLEPRAADALARANGRAGAAPAPGGTTPASPPLPGVTPSPEAHPPDCGPALAGTGPLLTGRRLVLLAGIPDSREIPALVGGLACQAARSGIRTGVALELLRADQELVDTYLASPGSLADRAAFLRLAKSFGSRPGVGSPAVLGLLDQLRTMRDAGLPLSIVAFDEPGDARGRDRARARTLERFRRADPDGVLLVMVQPSRARTVLRPGETEEQAPVGWYLVRWGLRPVPLAPRPASGAAPGPAVQLSASADGDGFQGDYVGGLLAPLPAGKP
jgi:hypothetical protein